MLNDLRVALRSLRRAPAFLIAAVTTLALAIAVNTIVFTLINALFFRRLPVRDAAAIVRIFPVDPDGREENLFSFADYRSLAARAPGLAGMAAYIPVEVTAVEGDGAREALAYAVSPTYLPLLGMEPVTGRSFPAEEEQGDARVAVVSHQYAVRRFGTPQQALGRDATLNGHVFTIVGVSAERFMGTEPLAPDFWLPLSAEPVLSPGTGRLHDPRQDWLLLIGRLDRGVDGSSVEEALSAVVSRIAAEAGDAARRPTAVHVVPATFFPARSDLKPVIALVLAIVLLVLVMACANIANLMLTRAAARQRDVAVRLALGASTWRLARHLLAESLVIAAAGGAAGLLLSAWTLRALYPIGMAMLPFRWAGVTLDLTPDPAVFGYACLLSVGAGIAFGLAPLARPSSAAIAAGLRGHQVLGLRVHVFTARDALVAVQLAICLTVLATAVLAARSLHRTRTLDLGFDPRALVHTSADLVRHGYTPESAAALHDGLTARLRARPDVIEVARTTHVPLSGGVRRARLGIEGIAEGAVATVTAISPRYFAALGIPVIGGRDFTAQETAADLPVAIISSALARRFWPGQAALGRRITVEGGTVPLTIVGVVRDAVDVAIWREKEIALYVPAGPSIASRLRLVVRTTGDPEPVANFLRMETRRFDPRLDFEAEPLERMLAIWILPSRVAAVAASVLGALALGMASIGLYGVVAYAVAQRQREIGIRLALGATTADVGRLLVSDGARMIGAGLGAGLIGAVLVSRATSAILPALLAADALTLAAPAAILVLTAALAFYLPTRTACRISPAIALRAE